MQRKIQTNGQEVKHRSKIMYINFRCIAKYLEIFFKAHELRCAKQRSLKCHVYWCRYCGVCINVSNCIAYARSSSRNYVISKFTRANSNHIEEKCKQHENILAEIKKNSRWLEKIHAKFRLCSFSFSYRLSRSVFVSLFLCETIRAIAPFYFQYLFYDKVNIERYVFMDLLLFFFRKKRKL